MKVLLVAAVVVLIHGSYATLLIKGPTEPVLEGEMMMLECLYSDSELNISQVHFEIFSKFMQRWRPLWEQFWCRYSMQIKQTAGSLVLSIPRAATFYEGPYRCVSDAANVTAPDNASQVLAIKVHYMGDLTVFREGYSSYLGSPQELKLRPGDNVVLKCSASSSEEPMYTWTKDGGDWILPSSELTLNKVNAMDEGLYTCTVEHPSIASFSKSRTISISVLPETLPQDLEALPGADSPWYTSSNGHLMLMTSAVAMSLLMITVVMSVFLCRRAKQFKTNKGPIDDHSQKKPIYKTSAESLPSTCGDKQPLV